MNPGPLLAFIRQHESRGNYNVVWAGIRKDDRPKRLLTLMTVAEVLAWQDSIDARYRSEAAGAYQILEDTLRGLVKELRLSGAELFDAEMQDRLAVRLLERRGLLDYVVGRISTERFGNQIAMEWASMPVLSAIRGQQRDLVVGQSYYEGDGLNMAHADPARFREAIEAVREVPYDPPGLGPAIAAATTGTAALAAGADAAGVPWGLILAAAVVVAVVVAAIFILRRRK